MHAAKRAVGLMKPRVLFKKSIQTVVTEHAMDPPTASDVCIHSYHKVTAEHL
jgi:hypothetical protein